MSNNEDSSIKLDTFPFQSKQFRPEYNITKENLIQLLDYYFPYLEQGDIDNFYKNIIQANYKLNELEFIAEKILSRLSSLQHMLDKKPSQVNILDYALEIYVDQSWDNSEKDVNRINIIEKFKESENVIERYHHLKNYYSKDDISFHFVVPALTYFDSCLDYENDNEPSYTESEYYDDDLDWSEQGGDFWDDVI